MTQEEKREYYRRYYQANKERLDAYLRQYRAEHPEKYRSLTVRMYGFSEYFVTLSPVQQIGVLNRTVY